MDEKELKKLQRRILNEVVIRGSIDKRDDGSFSWEENSWRIFGLSFLYGRKPQHSHLATCEFDLRSSHPIMDPCWKLGPYNCEISELERTDKVGRSAGVHFTSDRCEIRDYVELYQQHFYADANPELLQILYGLSVDLNWRADNAEDQSEARAFELLSKRLHGFVKARNVEMRRLTGYPRLEVC